MRRLVLLAALVVSFAAPGAIAAGGCPTDPGGLVDKETYRVGELIQFFDSYTDFGDPGTTNVTVTVDQTSGIATRTDVVTIRALNAPNTAVVAAAIPPADGASPLVPVALVAGVFALASLYLRRQRPTHV